MIEIFISKHLLIKVFIISYFDYVLLNHSHIWNIYFKSIGGPKKSKCDFNFFSIAYPLNIMKHTMSQVNLSCGKETCHTQSKTSILWKNVWHQRSAFTQSLNPLVHVVLACECACWSKRGNLTFPPKNVASLQRLFVQAHIPRFFWKAHGSKEKMSMKL